MANLSEILNTVPALAGASTEQRQAVLDRVYEGMKSSGQINANKLREFRNDQLAVFNTDDAKDKNAQYKEPTYAATGELQEGSGGYTPIDNFAGGSSVLGASISQYLPKNRDLASKLARRNTLEDLRDLGRVASDWEANKTALKKMAQDLVGLGMSAFVAGGGLEGAGFQLTKRDTVEKYEPGFNESLEKFNQLDSVKSLNEYYNDVIKDDPELAKKWHAGVVDGIIGTFLGAGRAAKAVQMLAESGAVKTGLTAMREFFAPVASNVLGGQVVYSGIEALDKALEDTNLSDEVKLGTRLGFLAIAAGASAMGPERWVEKVITNDSKAVRVAEQIGKLADNAEQAGIDFKTALAQNPDLSKEAREVLGIQTEVDPATGQILNPTAIEDSLDTVASTVAKIATGQELSAEEAATAKALEAEVPISPIKPEEMASTLGPLSSQIQNLDSITRKIDTVTNYMRVPKTTQETVLSNRLTRELENTLTADPKLAENLMKSTENSLIYLNDRLNNMPKDIPESMLADMRTKRRWLQDRFTFLERFQNMDINAKYINMPQNGTKMAPQSTQPPAGMNINVQSIGRNGTPILSRHDGDMEAGMGTQKPMPTPEVAETKTGVQILNAPAQQQRVARQEPTWDSITLSRQALESLDMLTSSGRMWQRQLKKAEKFGDEALATQLRQNIKDVQAQVADAQKIITLEMGGSRDLLKLVDKEIKDIDSQLSNMRNEWRSTELEARKAELVEKGQALKETLQRMKDRKAVFQRIPAKADKNLIQRLRDEQQARIYRRKPEPSKPWQPKTEVRDPETILNELPETERMRASKITQAAVIGKADILGRSLTEEERLDTLAEVLKNRQSWSDNPFTPSDIPLTKAPNGESLVLAGYVGERYPLVGQVLNIVNPSVAKTGVYTPDAVLQLAQALTARSGLGMDDQGWFLSRDITNQSYQLWDDVRSGLPKSSGSNLREFLKTAMPSSRPATVDKISSTINKAFPELDLSFKMDALPKGVAATADSLSRLVTVGLNKVELKELMHEIGHLNFWHGMDADTRITWMDSMRERAKDEVSWANAFPEYAERQMANAELDDVARANSEFWMQNPSEMYAQQFSAYTLSNVLPTVETLGTFQRAWRGLKRTMGLATDTWETLPADTKQVMIKTLNAPEPIEARMIPTAEIEDGLKSSWLYSEKDLAESRVLETRQMLETTYGQRTAPMPTSETEIIDVAQNVPMANFFDLPWQQRVASYSLEDLPKVGEMQALSLLYDFPGASYDELRGVLQRLQETLSGDRRADLLDSMVISRQKEASPYDRSFDPASGQYYSPSEIAEANAMTALGEYNRLDKASKNAIASDNARKYKREWVRRKDAAIKALDEEVAAGTRTEYTKQDVEALADSIWNERPATTLEGSARAIYNEDTSVATTTEQLYTQAERQLATMDANTDDLVDFTKYVLASKGMTQPINVDFTRRLSKAEMYSRIASGQAHWRWPSLMWRAGVQSAYIGLTGLKYDPDGTYIPFLGTVTWDPETFYETAPLGVFLLPGGWRSAKWLGKQSLKVTKPMVDKAISSLPLSTRLKLENIGRAVRKGFMASGGLPTELQQAVRNAQILGQSKKQDFYAFAETMHRHFTPEERETIAKIYEQRPGIDDLIFDMAENRPDVMAAVEMTRKLYSTVPDQFKALGLWSKNFEDLEDHYINRVYEGIGKKPTSAIFLNYNISPVRANFLKRRGLEAVIKNGKTAEAGESSIDALTQLRRNSTESGVELREGLKLNSWEASDGTILYSIPDTEFDKALRGQKLTPMYQWNDKGTGYVVTEMHKSSFKVRRDYTVKEREGMGEVVDVAVRSAAMGEQLERDLRQGQAFFNIANSQYARKVTDKAEIDNLIEQGWTKVEDTIDKQTGLQKFGALSGMYIHPDAKIALQMATGKGTVTRWLESSALGDVLLKGHRKLLGAWKVSKTVLSPIAQVNNFVSNLFMGYLMGHNSVSDLTTGLHMSGLRNMEIRAKQLTKEGKVQEASALYDKMRQDEYYQYFQEMRQARMSDSSLWANELNSYSLLEELRREKLPSDTSQLGRVQRVLEAGYNAIGKGWGGVSKKAGNWYEKGDLIYKMGAFVNARRHGRSANDAVKYAYEAYFDYGNLSPVARALRDSGLVPFVSYMYNAIPALARSVTEHPDRIATVGLMLEGLHLAGVGAVYGGDDLIAKREAIDAAMPEYMQKRQLGGLFRTRILNPFGSDANMDTPGGNVAKHQFLDLSRMIPGGDLFETGAGVNSIDFSLSAPGELLYSFLNQNPIVSFASTVATGKNPQLGYSIVDGGNIDTEATRERRADKVSELLYNTIAPNLPFLPGTPTFNAITDALKPVTGFEWGQNTGLDELGLPKSLGTAIAGSFGVKMRDVYPELSMEHQLERTDREMQKEENRLSRIFNSPRYTEEYKQQELKALEQSYEEVEKKQTRRVELLQRLNDARRAVQGAQTLPH